MLEHMGVLFGWGFALIGMTVARSHGFQSRTKCLSDIVPWASATSLVVTFSFESLDGNFENFFYQLYDHHKSRTIIKSPDSRILQVLVVVNSWKLPG